MHIVVSTTKELPLIAGKRLSDALIAMKEFPTLLLVSGGSSLALLSYVRRDALGSHQTICVLDERAGDPAASNFLALTKTPFYTLANRRGVVFIDSAVAVNEAPEILAARLDNAIRAWRKNHTDGRTVATFGIGTDAHVAGIMPFPENPPAFNDLFEPAEALYVGYDAGTKNPYRLRATASLPLLRSIDAGIAFVSGEDKRPALEKVIFRNALASAPAAVLAHIPVVELHTDIRGLPMVE